MTYKQVTVGGTFDHLHAGHKKLIAKAFEIGERIFLGITTDAFVKHDIVKRTNYIASLEPYLEREKYVKKFLGDLGWLDRTEIIPIENRFGTTLDDEDLEAIVVSPETELVATEINLKRTQKNWSALEVELVPWVMAEDGKPIHSVRIRKGEIDRDGDLYQLLPGWGVRQLPNAVREELKKPLGKLIQDESKHHETAVNKFAKTYFNASSSQVLPGVFPGVPQPASPVNTQEYMDFELPMSTHHKASMYTMPHPGQSSLLIAVGDAVTDALLKIGVTPDVSIVDLHIARKRVYKTIEDLGFRDIKVFKNSKNEAGTLSYLCFKELESLIHREAKPSVMQIEGEEDLVTLLAILIAPLKSLIVYGQPSEGVVVVEVGEGDKKRSQEYLSQFIRMGSYIGQETLRSERE